MHHRSVAALAFACVLALAVPAHAFTYPPRQPVAAETPDLVSSALRYLGTNPGRWGFAWCARFIRWLKPDLAPQTNDLAASFLALPRTDGHRGAVAVITWHHTRIDHVAIVERVDSEGVHIVGGNQSHRVTEAVISPDNVYAYVEPAAPIAAVPWPIKSLKHKVRHAAHHRSADHRHFAYWAPAHHRRYRG